MLFMVLKAMGHTSSHNRLAYLQNRVAFSRRNEKDEAVIIVPMLLRPEGWGDNVPKLTPAESLITTAATVPAGSARTAGRHRAECSVPLLTAPGAPRAPRADTPSPSPGFAGGLGLRGSGLAAGEMCNQEGPSECMEEPFQSGGI